MGMFDLFKQQPQQQQQPHKKFSLWLDSYPSWRDWLGL